MDVYTIIYLIM